MTPTRMLLLSLVAALPVFPQVPESFDSCPAAAQEILRKVRSDFRLPGITAATSSHGRLSCAGAVGFADPAAQRPMKPRTLMRIGSISKTVTAMAIIKLAEAGKLRLDDKFLDLFPDLLPAAGLADPRWRNVTLRHLLQHSLGWDRAIGGEPIQNSLTIARDLNFRGPATSTDGTGFAPSPAGTIVSGTQPVTGSTVRIGTGLFQANVVVPTLPPGGYPVSITVNGVPTLVPGLLPVC